MNKWKFIGFIVVMLASGCSFTKDNQEKEELLVFNVNDTENIRSVNISELGIEDIEYVPLETREDLHIRKIKAVRLNGDIFLNDNDKNLRRFSIEGKYLNDIGQCGRGPGEFSSINEFSIDRVTGDIFVKPLLGNKILRFSASGALKDDFVAPNRVRHIEHVRGQIVCYAPNINGAIDSSLVIIDEEGRELKRLRNKYQYKPKGKDVYFYPHEYLSCVSDGKLYFQEMYSDTVFRYDNSTVSPAYVINFNGKKLSVTEREEISSFENFMAVNKSHVFQDKLLEVSAVVYSEFHYNGKPYCFVGSKKEKSSYLIDGSIGFINDIDGGPNIRFKATDVDNNMVISWIDAYALKAHVASDAFKNSKPQYPEKKKALEKLANSLSEDDNPVLMLVRLKE
ncbi:6-bladed beta-propeller [Puteibacter caeruleilacunae]|nr:6-bladed beta-propeller [Puteibacter caeruleilacunae]